jgi:cyclopropane fatty-acyl-phospholipid synthase-like methyltransferase
MGEWYAELFDERYLRFYEDAPLLAPATAEAAFVEAALALPPGARVLDLGCGTGRHSVALALRGHEVTGLDLSAVLLARARRLADEHGARVAFVEADMRALAGRGPFDACVSLYTAFGYLGDAEDERTLAGIHAALHPAGQLLLDLTNYAPFLRPTQSTSWREGARGVAREIHRYDPFSGFLLTARTQFLREGGVNVLPESRVRAYLPHEVVRLLRGAGFSADRMHGDLADVPFDWDRSPRQVYLARRADAPPALCPA